MISMVEHGIANNCPICKQTEWRKKMVKKNLIVPTQARLFQKEDIKEDKHTNSKKCCDFNIVNCCISTKKTLRVCNFYVLMLGFAFVLGMFTLGLSSIDFGKELWIPFVVGFCELILILLCCLGCCDKNIVINFLINPFID